MLSFAGRQWQSIDIEVTLDTGSIQAMIASNDGPLSIRAVRQILADTHRRIRRQKFL
jgi:hypothetical protein